MRLVGEELLQDPTYGNTSPLGRVAEREDKLWRNERYMGRKQSTGTRSQNNYIIYLENLTGMQTSGAAGGRIRQLQQEAKRLGIPDYRWKPYPVKRTTDPSRQRPPDRRKRTIDRTTREFFFESRSGSNGDGRPPDNSEEPEK